MREILVMAGSPDTEMRGSSSLLELADYAEPMSILTNAEIDQAIYGG